MMKIFDRLKRLNQLEKEEAELLELQATVVRLYDDTSEIIEEAKLYLSMLGITEKDLERIVIKQKLHVVK